MQLNAILKARAVARFDVDELNLNGKVRVADLVKPLVDEFNFLTFPSKPEDFDIEKGIKFGSGRMGDKVIDVFSIHPTNVFLETLSNTDDSQECLTNIFAWGRDNFGLSYSEGMIRRWAYVNSLTFTTDFELLSALSSPLDKLGKKMTGIMDDLFGEGLTFKTSHVGVSHDPLMRKTGIASFTIQHRANNPFCDFKYFSEAPLPTKTHIQFLEELEADIKRGLK